MTLIQVVNSYLVWGGVALHCADKISEAHYENTIKEFLLSVVKYVPDCYNSVLHLNVQHDFNLFVFRIIDIHPKICLKTVCKEILKIVI